MVLVNSAWRSAAQTPHLYAHHLSRCPSFSISNNVVAGPFTDDSLAHLKRKFLLEIKRNLFQAYLRPRQTTINFISTTTSLSAAFPGGEAFEFIFSPNGQWCLALSSSRIYVIDTASQKVSVKRELKVFRRPLSAAILDKGGILAVLSSDHQVNVYDLSNSKVQHLRSVSLDNPPHTITLSQNGEVLAAAYDGGIEVHSLAAAAVATDRRAVKCDRVDSLMFSKDGAMLLGTTRHSKHPNTVILSAPYFTEAEQDLPTTELISQMWTSQILFPNSSRDCSHATLLPHRTDGDASWTFTYDRVFESFRAVRTDDLRNGTTYFTGPIPERRSRRGRRRSKTRLTPCTLPAVSQAGDLVSAGFLGSEIWLYGVPEGLDAPAVSHIDDGAAHGAFLEPIAAHATGTSPARSITRGESEELERLPQWQVLVDKYRNVFAKGRRVANVIGVANTCWVGRGHLRLEKTSVDERLIIAAPGGVSGSEELDEDQIASVDGGRLVILDFHQGIKDGECEEMTIEVGNAEPELLEEENMDMDTEIALVRRRTVAQRRDGLSRTSVAGVLGPAPDITIDAPPMPPLPGNSSSVGFGLGSTARDVSPLGDDPPAASESPPEGLSLQEASEAFDGPYSHTHPRSRISLYRSATAVEASRRRQPPPMPSSGRVEFRRADGRGELPHESDADNWVPPPPPYKKDADNPLPDHLRLALMPREDHNQRPRVNIIPRRPMRSNSLRERPSQNRLNRRPSSLDLDQTFQSAAQPQPERQFTESISTSRRQASVDSVSTVSASAYAETAAALSETSSNFMLSPESQARRPMSALESRSSNARSGFRGRFTSRLTSPISPIPEPVIPTRNSPGQSISLPSSPVNGRFTEAHHLTLSGANLQQRLDYPVPPTPRENNAPPSPPSPPTQRRRGRRSYFASELAQQPVEAVLPSPQQIANLQNRNSRHQPSLSNAHAPSLMDRARTLAASGPPRGALGATGNSFRTEAPARSLSRNGSNRSARSVASASTPNLLRPSTRRLDTIQSVASSIFSHTRTRSRERDVSPEFEQRPIGVVRSQSDGPMMAGGGHVEVIQMPERRGWRTGLRGRRMSGDLNGEVGQVGVDGERAWGGDSGGGAREEKKEKKKRGTKCIVM